MSLWRDGAVALTEGAVLVLVADVTLTIGCGTSREQIIMCREIEHPSPPIALNTIPAGFI